MKLKVEKAVVINTPTQGIKVPSLFAFSVLGQILPKNSGAWPAFDRYTKYRAEISASVLAALTADVMNNATKRLGTLNDF
jgi:hypothetical protein